MTDCGEAFVTIGELNKETQLYRLDRSAGAWVPIAAPAGTRTTLPSDPPRSVGPELFGGDGDRLAFRSYDEANGWEFKFFDVAPAQQPSAQ